MTLPGDVRRLVRRHVRSVGDLDLLVLLHGDRARAWTAEEVCEMLRCPPGWAGTHLEALRAAGLAAVEEGRWRFAPADAELERATDALADAYRNRPSEVVRLVFVRGMDHYRPP